MSRAELIYPLRRMIERELQKASQDVHNGELLIRYYKVRSTQVALATVYNEFSKMNLMSRMLGKKFEDSARQDMEDLLFRIDQKGVKPNTSNKYRKILRAFFQWLEGCPKGEFPQSVRWITLKKVPYVTVTVSDLIPFQDCVRISECAKYFRDKAWIQCMLDAGCRIGEVLTPTVGEVEMNDHGAVIHSDGKTDKAPLILTWSAKVLAVWLNIHPFKDDKEAPLWPLLNREKPSNLSYAGARRIFVTCAKKSGLTRRVWLHLLKHVSSTYDADIGMPDAYRKYKHHWKPGSRMNQVYEHLSRTVITKIQQDAWSRISPSIPIPIETTSGRPEAPGLCTPCKRCEFQNPVDSKFCNRCGFGLKEVEASKSAIAKAKMNAFIDRLSDDPKKLDKFLSALG